VVRILILAFLVYILYRVVRGVMGIAGPVRRDERGDVIDDMVQDPNCGTYVPRGEAVRRRIRGEDHFFCSETCADQYEEKERGGA
jgi:uncharacterized protein